MNTLSNLNVETVNELLSSFDPDSENTGVEMWNDRLISYLTGIKKLSSFLEETKVDRYLELKRLICVTYGEDYEDNFKTFGENYSTAVSPLRLYLKSLARFDETKLYDQLETTNEQHGYVMMQLQLKIKDKENS